MVRRQRSAKVNVRAKDGPSGGEGAGRGPRDPILPPDLSKNALNLQRRAVQPSKKGPDGTNTKRSTQKRTQILGSRVTELVRPYSDGCRNVRFACHLRLRRQVTHRDRACSYDVIDER